MANWYRSGRYYGRNRTYSRWYRTKYYKRGQTRRSYGTIKAAKQQSDNVTFTINIPSKMDNVYCKRQNISGFTDVYGTYAMNIYDLMRKSEFYQNYANMYDEFKIENIKVKLLPTSFYRKQGADLTYTNLTVYTAWDRTGLNDSQLRLITAGVYDNQAISATDTRKNYEVIGKNGDDDGLYCIVGENITTYSSAESRQVNPNSISTITRWLKPKTITEKSQWLSTSSLKNWYDNYSEGGYHGIPTGFKDDIGEPNTILNLADNTITADVVKFSSAVSTNPCFLKEDPSIKFKPTLLVGIYPEDTSDGNIPDMINFNVETEVVVTFRGLRKAAVVA